MAQAMDYAEYLSKEIGARPAGTEEEQQAALYITEQFQKEAGFTATIEEFSNGSDKLMSRAILAAVIVVVTLLAIIFPVLNIPALILCVAAAVIYALEEFDKPIMSKILSRGASQNVVAKYQPNFDEANGSSSRRRHSRKVILVAHYDTGHATPALVEKVESTGLPLPVICLGAIVASAFFQLLRVFMAPGGGIGLVVLNFLSILAILVCVLPIVKAIMMRQAAYNEGANNNATGTAALIEVARRISRGSVSEADLAQDAGEELYIHGEEAAREAGLIPEGVQIRYEAEQLTPPSQLGAYDEEERLLSAKAAIAALTGKPVERRVYGSVADKLVNSYAADEGDHAVASQSGADGQYVESGPFGFDVPANEPSRASSDATTGTAEGFENAPSWFIAAQKNARKSAEANESKPVDIQRSAYTEAIENAERAFATREEELRLAEQAEREAALKESLATTINEKGDDREEQPEPEQHFYEVDLSSYDDEGGIAGGPDQPYVEPIEAPELASPSSTIAMAAPVPAAEIAAEAALYDDMQVVAASRTDEFALDAAPIQELPMVEVPKHEVNETSSPSRSGLLRKLRTDVPSLSGLIDPVTAPPRRSVVEKREVARKQAAEAVPSVVQAPSPTATVERKAESASSAGADYTMEVPRSRSASLLNRFRQNDEKLQETPQEWLDIDENFDARTVGRERGGWESFRDDLDKDAANPDNGSGAQGRTWQGGAYSRMQLGHVNMRSGADTDADTMIPQELPEDEVNPSLTGEIEQIYHFRNPQFNTEIWFVAMGSDTEGHDGARAFIEEHRDELRGSMVIEIESLGAGVLSVATQEGRVRTMTASSRVKRYTRAAVAATGIALDEVSLAGTDSIASVVQKAGFQSMHLFGAENNRPALKGSPDDVLENVDELVLDDNVNFIFELLKH